MTSPNFSIVVPTYRRPEALRDALAAICRLEDSPDGYEIIVVDDGQDEATAGIVDAFRGPGPEMSLLTQSRRGAAAARNLGAQAAHGEMLLFVDDDILVAPDHLRRHRLTRQHYGDPLVNGAWEFAPSALEALRSTAFGRFRIELERSFAEQARGGRVQAGCLELPLLGTWDLALRKEAFWELGGFDEDFPVAGAEDQDFSLRARAAGYRLLLDTEIVCLHNDNRLDLKSYCAREERSAQTMPFLARKYPDEFGEVPYVRENRPMSLGDPAPLIAKKALKNVLATRPALDALHALATPLEALRVPERLLRRYYTALLGIHLFRGFRQTWTK